MKSQVTALGLRFVSLVSSFLTYIAMARYVSQADLGVYGVMNSFVLYGSTLLGFELYQFAHRRYLRSGSAAVQSLVVGGQAATVLSFYPVTVGAMIISFLFTVGNQFVAFFLVLLVTEHISQELYRLLLARRMAVQGNILLLVRNGLWAWAWVGSVVAGLGTAELRYVLLFSCCGSVASILLGLLFFVGQVRPKWNRRLLGWSKAGMTVAGKYVVSSCINRAFFLVDKAVVFHFAGPQAAGAYVFYSGLAQGAAALIDAGVISHYYPEIVRQGSRNRSESGTSVFVRMALSIAGVGVVYGVAGYLLLPFVLELAGAGKYLPSLWMFVGMMTVIVTAYLALVPHYVLYAQGRDWDIVKAGGVSLAVLAVGLVLLVGARAVSPATVMTALGSAFLIKLVVTAGLAGLIPVPRGRLNPL